jgi:hypothetical protein
VKRRQLLFGAAALALESRLWAQAARYIKRVRLGYKYPSGSPGHDQYGAYYAESAFTRDGIVETRYYVKMATVKTTTNKPQDVPVIQGERPQPAAAQPDNDQPAPGDPQAAPEPEVEVGYQFGSAGIGAAGQAFAYGVASSLAGLDDGAERIAAMQETLQAMRDAVAAQAASGAMRMAIIRSTLEARGDSIADQVSAPATLPSGAFNDVLRQSDQLFLFATPDPMLAIRLNRVATAMRSADPAKVPGAVKDFTQALVRQSDAESAIGNAQSAETLYQIAGGITEAALGFVPVVGAMQSAYELVVGQSLITGQQLSTAERAFAAVNLALLGEFAPIEQGLEALAKAGRIVGGTRGVAIGKAVVESLKRWPLKALETIRGWRAGGLVVAGEERIIINSRALVPAAAVDGTYARVMPKQFAEALKNGGRLTGPNSDMAFIAEARSLDGLHTWDEIRRKLSLTGTDGTFAPFGNEVVVEFKFTSDEPLAYLARPFGSPGSNGPLWLPGGYTAGGAREWVIDPEAVSKGLIDVSTIKIKSITP